MSATLAELKESLRHEEIINFIRCGFRLQACPTYNLSLP